MGYHEGSLKEINDGMKRIQDRYQRIVSTTERCWLAIDRQTCPFVISLVLEGRGGLDIGDLTNAVYRASSVNPGCRLVLKGALQWSRWQDSGTPPPVSVVSGKVWDGYGSRGAPFLARRLPENGPTCEVLMVEGYPPRLIFRAHHGVMDGRGIFTWVEDVFRTLRGEEPLGAYD